MNAMALRADNLCKRFHLGTRAPYHRFSELLTGLPRALARKLAGGGSQTHAAADAGADFWALRDVSFEVAPGEVLGVIGRNGAGKSTLLKVLARITEPTTGQAEVYGRVGSLLEVGTGFHPELTGRENIFLNGAVLGMSRAQVRKNFDAIVAFAEVERFLDTPVKHYSSGMYMRLAFAVAAHLEPDILLIDEVLAVGDSAFQRKCLGKMNEVAQGGRTVLFVSHNMSAVRQLCQRALLLEGGRVAACGPVDQVLERYATAQALSAYEWRRDESQPAPQRPHFRRVFVCDETGAPATCVNTADPLRLTIELATPRAQPGLCIACVLCNEFGHALVATGNFDSDAKVPEAPGVYRTTLSYPPELLMPKRYTLMLTIYDLKQRHDHLENPLVIYAEPAPISPDKAPTGRMGDLRQPCHWAAFTPV